jgi:lipid-binding SYLF domain-containing protein
MKEDYFSSMVQKLTTFLALGALAFLVAQPSLHADNMEERSQAALHMLEQKQASAAPIPGYLISHAKGVAFFTVTQAGLGIGGKGGRGIVISHLGNSASHSWTAPSAFNLDGANIGVQIGFTESRYIVILNTDEAVRHFTGSGKMNFDATASGTAGSTTATERVSTSELSRREVIVYKDSGGVFGGAVLGGTSIERQSSVNRAAYGDPVRVRNILDGTVPAPQYATPLYILLNGNS